MTVEHFMGKALCTNYEELENVLKIRTEKGVNEFVISGEEYYPFIMMAVKDDYATITYFEKDDTSFVSIGGNTDLGEDGISIFYTNTDEEEIEVENCSVIPFSKAVMVIKEFFETMRLPECIEWEEL